MIADDEEYEREYLNRFITANYAGILQIVYSAKDGAQVLEKAGMLRPDIILLDIRMPRLDGLEAAEEIRRKYPQTELIILSAYGEFSYARQAIKLGVKDFLVKPYLDEELSGTLNRLLASMDLSTGEDKAVQPDEKERLYEDVDRDVVWDLAFARKKDAGLRKELMMWGIHGESYKCLTFYHDSIRTMGTAGCEVIKGFFRLEDAHVVINYLFGQIVLYVFADDELAYTEINRCVRRTRTYLRDLGTSTVFCGVSGIYTDLNDSEKAFEEAAGYITEYSSEEVRNGYQKMIDDTREVCVLEDKICFSIANRNGEQSRSLGRQLISLLEQYDGGSETGKGSLCRITMAMVRRLNSQSASRIRTEDAMRIYSLLADDAGREKAGGERSTESRLDEVFEIMLCAVRTTPINNNTMVVRKAKEYMDTHYGEAISLQSVADELGISSGYLSKCFKNVEEISFTEYLTNKRLEAAKKLMRETQNSISEIAYLVGFSDPNYFGKCFKKNEQISPKEYYAMQNMSQDKV